MAQPIIIDRRKNPGQKNLSNRQRFIERFKGRIKEAARKHVGDRSISDSGDQEITIPGGTEEPQFHHTNSDGDWDYVLPGNTKHIPGDTIDKPRGGSGGKGTKGSIDGDGEDEFSFLLSYEEYLDMIFDDLELPDLVKSSQKSILSKQYRHAGFTTTGVPSNLNVERTAISGLSRRIALKSPKLRRVLELEAMLEDEEDEDKKNEILEEIRVLRIRANAISFLDNVDMRFNNFTPQLKPITQAVMICVMDISGSMGEKEKVISKKFFLLLHLFLQRQYENTEVVFIRHHHEAQECDEHTFFTDRSTGGTVVSTAYEVALKAIKDRYPSSDWNIYLAQASDGDNAGPDNPVAAKLLSQIMPLIQYMFYIEIGRVNFDEYSSHHDSDLCGLIKTVKLTHPNIAIEHIFDEANVVTVFRRFFARNKV